MKPWLVVLCFYFGRWPSWIDLFVESCKWNPDVRWRIYTDCGEPSNKADNIDYVHISFADYRALAGERLGIRLDFAEPRMLCGLRAALGFIFENEIRDYRFFGFGDLDVIFGRISDFYSPQQLAGLDVISTHPERISGHFAVLRNTDAMRRAFWRIPDYEALLRTPDVSGVEEYQFGQMLLASKRYRALFVERYSTVLSRRGWHDGTMNYPQRWFWRKGRLTNDRDGEREFLYLHFMRWQAAHWINDPPVPGEAAWVGREIIHTDWRRAANQGFCISAAGFHPIE